MAGIRRAKGTAQQGKKPIVTEDLRRMLKRRDSLQGLRDRPLLLVEFAGAFGRSELVGLDTADVEFNRDLVVTVRRLKTDQEGQGRRVGIPYGSHAETCPVRAAQTGWTFWAKPRDPSSARSTATATSPKRACRIRP
jgi:site-specific recombinase XerC